MPFIMRKTLTDVEWKTAVSEKRVVGDRVYATKKQADDAKKSNGAKPKGKAPGPRKGPKPPQYEAVDVQAVANVVGSTCRWTIPAQPADHKLGSIQLTFTPNDALRCPWRYVVSDTCTTRPDMTYMVTNKFRGDHDVSFFSKGFNLVVPDELKIVGYAKDMYVHVAWRSVLADPADTAPTFEVSARFLKPKASTSALVHI
jgi:hypothetical protein